MRETRTSGSEGGGGDASPYPYQAAAALDCRVKPGNDKESQRQRQICGPTDESLLRTRPGSVA